jgi:enoyl-CoA hydratase/carnithine racemase
VSDVVLTERRDQALWIAINRPERRNALNQAVAEGIAGAIEAAEADGAVRAIVLTGVGDKAFSAGGDLQTDAGGAPFTMDPANPRHDAVTLLRKMEQCRLPLIARVNGAALAGGFGLVCACDLVVAREDALLGVPEVRVGLFPMMIMPFLARVVGHRKLMEMCLTGEPFPAREAIGEGLLNYVTPADELDAKVAWLLERIVSKSPTAIRLGKQALKAMRGMSFDAALDYAQFTLANLARTQDAREGLAAFNERREPRWTGE